MQVLNLSSDVLWSAVRNQVDIESLDEQNISNLVNLACLLLSRQARKDSQVVANADACKGLARIWLGLEKNEVFGVIYLDAKLRVIDMVAHFHGTVNYTAVHPRVIAHKALELHAQSVILVHNHPSSCDPEPSDADIAITKHLQKALRLFDIDIVDHLIVGNTVLSMTERHLMP